MQSAATDAEGTARSDALPAVSRRYVNNINVSNTTVNTTVINNVYNTTIINNKTVNVTNINYVNRNVPGAVAATTSQALM